MKHVSQELAEDLYDALQTLIEAAEFAGIEDPIERRNVGEALQLARDVAKRVRGEDQ